MNMGRLLGRIVGMAFSGVMCASAIVHHNVIGAIFFGLLTLYLVWLAVRGERDAGQEVHPLRGLVGGAAVVTLIALVATIQGVEEQVRGDRGMGVFVATLTVPGAIGLWAVVAAMWRRGWRWTSTTTRGELQAVQHGGEPPKPPPPRESL